MTKLVSILLILIALIPACSNSKSAVHTAMKRYEGDRYIAWNDDTLMTCQFAIRKNYKFAYLMSSIDSNGNVSQKIYNGIVKSLDNKIYLFYDKDIKPANVQNFLIIEILGDYLIQDFTDGRKRMYLRIVHPASFR